MSKLTQLQIDGLLRRHTPKGWRVIFNTYKHIWGETDNKRRIIRCPHICPGESRFELFVFFHEVGHVRYRHDWYSGKNPVTGENMNHHRGHAIPHIEEYEAEIYAITAFRNEGIAIPRDAMSRARWNVGECIKKDRKKNRAILPHIEKWARS